MKINLVVEACKKTIGFRAGAVVLMMLILGAAFAGGVFAQTNAANLDEAIRLSGAAITQKLLSPRVAIISINSESDALSSYIIRGLAENMESARARAVVIPLENIENALKETNLKTSADVSANSARQIGRNLRADFAVTGSVELSGGNYILRINLINIAFNHAEALPFINIRDNAKILEMLNPAVQTAAASPAPASSLAAASSQSLPEPAVSMTAPEGYVPQYALEEAEQFKADFLIKNSQSASDLQYRFFYDETGRACLEYTVTPKGGYRWPTSTWIGKWWGNSSGSIGNNQINYVLTRKASDEAEYRIEQRRKDAVFNEIERVVYQIALEYDYDFASAYGRSVRYRTASVKRAVCDGYADAVIAAFANHPQVAKVEKWSSRTGNHAWNVIVLRDGRRIYCDATWYDGNSVDSEGYVVNVPVRNPVNLTFDIDEFNSLGGATDNRTRRLLSVHFGWSDALLLN